MAKLILIFIFFFSFMLAHSDSAKKIYWIDEDITVLTFLGNPYSKNVTPIKVTTSKKQKIYLFHKKSGPGIYAFYLEGLSTKNQFGMTIVMDKKGFFLAKSKEVRLSRYKKKISMKYTSREKIQRQKPKEIYYDYMEGEIK